VGKARRSVFFGLLLVAIGAPVALLVWSKMGARDAADYLSEQGFTRRDECPPAKLVERPDAIECWEGSAGGRHITLLLARRQRVSAAHRGAAVVDDLFIEVQVDGEDRARVWQRPHTREDLAGVLSLLRT
jgi:hypothetical protein